MRHDSSIQNSQSLPLPALQHYLHKSDRHFSTYTAKAVDAWINLVKALVGVGVFALPVAYKQSGLWVGCILTVLLGFANAHCMIKMVKCSQYLSRMKDHSGSQSMNKAPQSKSQSDSPSTFQDEDKQDYDKMGSTQPEEAEAQQNPQSKGSDQNIGVESKTQESSHDSAGSKSHSPQADQRKMEELETGDEDKSGRKSALDYGDMAKEAFATRETRLRVLALPAKLSVNICIVLLQIGICSVFYIFVTEHIKEVVDFLFGTNLEVKIIFFVVLPFFMLLVSFQSLTFMSRVSFAGNVFMAIVLAIVYVQLARSPHLPLSQLAGVTTISDAAVTSGSIMYALVAASVVLPLENKMRNPQQMLGFCGVISTSSIVCVALYISMGLMGYITYGSQIEGSITLNLTNNPVDFSVKVMLLLMTYCGYLIQYYPVTQMVWPIMEPYLSNAPTFLLKVANYAMRYTIVILSFLFAYTIPNLEKIIPIIGVSSGMLLVLVFPPIIESVIFWEQWKRRGVNIMRFHVILNAVYIVMGIFFLIVGVYDSVKSLNNQKHA